MSENKYINITKKYINTMSRDSGWGDPKSISHRVSRAMIMELGAVQRSRESGGESGSEPNSLDSTCCPFQLYERPPWPKIPQLLTPTPQPSPVERSPPQGLCGCFLLFLFAGYSGEFFNFTRRPKEKGVATTATANRSQLIVIVRGRCRGIGEIYT